MITTPAPSVRASLRELSKDYASMADSERYPAMATLFSTKGRLVSPSGTTVGHDALARAFSGLSRYESTFHMLGQSRYWQDQETIRGEIYCQAHHFSASTKMTMFIRYEDSYEAAGDSWLFSERVVLVSATTRSDLDPPTP